jgi:hypothetical protein
MLLILAEGRRSKLARDRLRSSRKKVKRNNADALQPDELKRLQCIPDSIHSFQALW